MSKFPMRSMKSESGKHFTHLEGSFLSQPSSPPSPPKLEGLEIPDVSSPKVGIADFPSPQPVPPEPEPETVLQTPIDPEPPILGAAKEEISEAVREGVEREGSEGTG